MRAGAGTLLRRFPTGYGYLSWTGLGVGIEKLRAKVPERQRQVPGWLAARDSGVGSRIFLVDGATELQLKTVFLVLASGSLLSKVCSLVCVMLVSARSKGVPCEVRSCAAGLT